LPVPVGTTMINAQCKTQTLLPGEAEPSFELPPSTPSRRHLRRQTISGILARLGTYASRIDAELATYADQEEVHDLPPIYHYWSERYCLPLLSEVGLTSLDGFWDREIAAVCARRHPDRARLVSLGAGNGDIELQIMARLRQQGISNLEVVLVELNPVMLDRGLLQAGELGLSGCVDTAQADFNSWTAVETADIYFAHHSLHHVVALEHLLDEVRGSLAADGVLLINDMIGRNGHKRWPEAAELVNRLWSVTPERYRFNHYTGDVDDVYPDWDCSGVGFEGVRAQDILPLLLARFHPETYITFANIIDPFVDRVYGPNFDPQRSQDTDFINAVARLDDATIDLRLTTPTHMIASFKPQPVACNHPRHRSPERTTRRDHNVAGDDIERE
jgi:SAM-dependent methyltransferase